MLFLASCVILCVREGFRDDNPFPNVCNPGLLENVITCVNKHTLVYVSNMAPVLSKNGFSTAEQLFAPRAEQMHEHNMFTDKLQRLCSTRETQFSQQADNYLQNSIYQLVPGLSCRAEEKTGTKPAG